MEKVTGLNSNEYVPYQKMYLDLVEEVGVIEQLKTSLSELETFFNTLPDEKLNFTYEKGKWTIKELLLHIIDTERIFQYRALRFAREDKTELPGFSENEYVAAVDVSKRTLTSLLNEYRVVRLSTISLFETFSNEELLRIGIASGFTTSVRAIAYLLIGHQRHHINIIKQRYLI